MATAQCMPDIETQKNSLSVLINKTLKKGDTWFLVESTWFLQWKEYVGFDLNDYLLFSDPSSHPGQIDNTALFKDNTNKLREMLIEGLDYQLVPEEGWNLLVSWYGLCEGQEPIARKVIEHGMFVKHCKVEVYYIDLKLCLLTDLNHVITKPFSRADTIEYIETTMRSVFGVSQNTQARLWMKYLINTYEQLDKAIDTVQDTGLYQGQVICLQLQNEDGTWEAGKSAQFGELQHRQQSQVMSMESQDDDEAWPWQFNGSKRSNQHSAKPKTAPLQAQGISNVQHHPLKSKPNDSKVKCDKEKNDSIEELITCVVCFSIMQDPRCLPCQHTFCFGCLKKLKMTVKNQKNGFLCPTCREFSTIKDAKKSFVIIQLIDIHHSKDSDEKKSSGILCSKHPSCPLEARCVPCNVDICSKCKFEEHDLHKSETFETAIQRKLTSISAKNEKVSFEVDEIRNNITSLKQKEISVKIMKDNLKSQVKKHKEELENAIQDKYDELLSEIDKQFYSIESSISSKITSLQNDITVKESFIASAATSIGDFDGYKLLAVLQDIDKSCHQQNEYHHVDVEIPDISFEKADIRFQALFGKISTLKPE